MGSDPKLDQRMDRRLADGPRGAPMGSDGLRWAPTRRSDDGLYFDPYYRPVYFLASILTGASTRVLAWWRGRADAGLTGGLSSMLWPRLVECRTGADVRLLSTLVRFDAVYVGHFK